jgi:hypothetical protein
MIIKHQKLSIVLRLIIMAIEMKELMQLLMQLMTKVEEKQIQHLNPGTTPH